MHATNSGGARACSYATQRGLSMVLTPILRHDCERRPSTARSRLRSRWPRRALRVSGKHSPAFRAAGLLSARPHSCGRCSLPVQSDLWSGHECGSAGGLRPSSILAARTAAGDPFDGLARTFFAAIQDLIDTPWAAAAVADFVYPKTRGERPRTQKTRSSSALRSIGLPPATRTFTG